MDESACLVATYMQLRGIKKTRDGPPLELEEDGVWAVDSTLDESRIAEAEKLISERQGPKLLSQFRVREIEERASVNWDAFYKRNSCPYRDRQYLDTVFKDALGGGILIELGAGLGNGVASILPLFSKVILLDFSSQAIKKLKERTDLTPRNWEARVCDVTTRAALHDEPVDRVTCLFLLSAVSPEKMKIVADNIYHNLKPGGRVLVRDYGRYDQAQLRFGKGTRLAENWYVKQDGTRCYYFSCEDLDKLFSPSRFRGKATYVCQRHLNRATLQLRRRVFVQAEYRRLPLF